MVCVCVVGGEVVLPTHLPPTHHLRAPPPHTHPCSNFITNRPSSRVLAPPGGATNWSLGGGDSAAPAAEVEELVAQPAVQAPAATATFTTDAHIDKVAAAAEAGIGIHNNNYTRPSGQNVGNFLTDKPSSRVLAPPGGTSSLVFG